MTLSGAQKEARGGATCCVASLGTRRTSARAVEREPAGIRITHSISCTNRRFSPCVPRRLPLPATLNQAPSPHANLAAVKLPAIAVAGTPAAATTPAAPRGRFLDTCPLIAPLTKAGVEKAQPCTVDSTLLHQRTATATANRERMAPLIANGGVS